MFKGVDSTVQVFPSLAEAAKAGQTDVFFRLNTSPGGLTWPEARKRLEQFGPNELTTQKPPGWPAVLLGAARHPFNGILLVLGAISFATGDMKATLVMVSMVVLSVGLRFWQEMKSSMQADSLRRMVHNTATVAR